MAAPTGDVGIWMLEAAIGTMRDAFDGNETEANWSKRQQAVKTMISIANGNSPEEFQEAFVAGIQSQVGGIVKAIRSLVSRHLEFLVHRLPCYTRRFLLVFPLWRCGFTSVLPCSTMRSFFAVLSLSSVIPSISPCYGLRFLLSFPAM